MINLVKKKAFKDNWLFCLIVLQPLLDALAFWRANEVATEAGYIRLAIMIALPLHLLFTLKKKRNFMLSMAVIGIFCVLHMLNGFRVGYINPYFDVAYIVKIAQMPVLTVCFIHYVRNEQTKKQMVYGIYGSAIITTIMLFVAVISGTYTPTYDGGIGISGWVINDNRCANSIIFVTLATFSIYYASKAKSNFVNIGIPVVVSAILLANGTTACYLGLFVIFGGFVGLLIFKKIINHDKMQRSFVVTLILVLIFSILIYPYTPRAEISAREANAANRAQNELELKLVELGYDPDSLSFEDKYNNPAIREIFEDFYYSMIGYVIPEMFEEFGMEKVLTKYNMTTNVEKLIDVRIMKIAYASLIWDECDIFTKLVGFEITRDCGNGHNDNDMENDWHALFYYCGYLGFGLYVAFATFFIALVIRKLIKNFKGSLTLFNGCILISYLLFLGLAHFSGAVLRRPNVSIYLSVVMALIYYQTCIQPINTPVSIQKNIFAL